MKPNSLGYIKGLDLLRFIAATGVILHHTSLQLKNVSAPFLEFNRYSGVFFLDLFFVISGYLISTIIFRESDAGQFNLKNFFMRRILRIWPMYFFTILLFVILVPLKMGLPGDDIGRNVLFASLFITNYQMIFGTVTKGTYIILWSVGIEEHIYIIFPFLMRILKKNKMILALILIVIGFLSWVFGYPIIGNTPYTDTPAYFLTTSYFYFFGAGCLLAILVAKQKDVVTGVAAILLKLPVQIVIILSGFAFIFSSYYPFCPLYVNLLVNAIFSCYLVFCAVNRKLIIDQFSEKISRFLGNVSYPMYLVHIKAIPLSFFIVRSIDASRDIKVNVILPLTVLVITVLFSALCHYLIERPFLKMKKRYTIVANK